MNRIRWWPLPLIAAAGTVGVIAARLILEEDRQSANTVSAGFAALAFLAALVWFFGFSAISRALRTRAGVILGGALLVLLACFRLRGVTGDLVPIFEPRWASASAVDSEVSVDLDLDQALPGLADFPQFLGPDRDGILAGPPLDPDWQTSPPEQLWRHPVGAGWSGFAVAGRRAITQEQHGDDEVVVCYDVGSGSTIWTHRDPTRYDNVVAGVGPRATPTIDGDRVFAQGATGRLSCLDLESGAVLWSVDILEDNGAPQPEWGVAGSPLVVGDRVIVNAGGDGRSLVAYEKSTGAFLWGGGSEPAHWSSPVLGNIAGTAQVLIFNARLVAHDLESGEVLWTHPWSLSHPHISNPVVLPGDHVLVSSGYGTGSELLHIERDGDGFSVTTLWHSNRLKAKFTNLVVRDGFVYGLDDGIMTCVDLEDGSRKWKGGRYGHGQVLLVGELLLVSTETGEVVLLEAVPDELRERARFTALDAKTWNPPALAGDLLLLRNDQEAACYRLPVR